MASVCLNHTERPATQRCKSCLRPICDDCVVNAEDGIYCSTRCCEDSKKYSERMAALRIAPKEPDLWDMIRGPFVFILGIGLVLGALWLISPGMAPKSVGNWIKATVYGEKPFKPKANPSSKPKNQ